MLVTYRSDQTGTTERPFGSLGHIVITETASAAGIASIPSPSGISGDPEADWFVWQAMFGGLLSITQIGIVTQEAVQYIIDSKAMRKVGPDDDLVGVFSQENAVGGIINTNGRRLIQLH